MFLVKSLKTLTDFFNIYHYVHFASNATRSGTSLKLVHNKPLSSTHQHFFFTRIVRLWNYLPDIDLSLHTNQINKQLKSFLWNYFINKFNPDLLCAHHVICLVQVYQSQWTLVIWTVTYLSDLMIATINKS